MIGWQRYPQQFSPYTVLRTSSIHRTVKAPWANLATSLGFWLNVPNPLLPLDSYPAIDAENCDWLETLYANVQLLAQPLIKGSTNPNSLTGLAPELTIVEPFNLIIVVLTKSLLLYINPLVHPPTIEILSSRNFTSHHIELIIPSYHFWTTGSGILWRK